MNSLFSALNELRVVAAPVITQVEATTLAAAGPWRPAEWSRPALTAITIPSTSPATQSVATDPFGAPLPGAPAYQNAPTVYVFDAILRAEHQRTLRRTEHPIQASASAPVASITDHAFLLPARVTLEIGMSDAMDSFYPGAWDGGSTKSISAWQTLTALQASRTLVTLTTRLDSYQNMIVESVATSDTRETAHGLRATVTLTQVFLADATGIASAISFGDPGAVSDRPQTTGATPSGIVQTTPVPDSLQQQNNFTSTTASNLQLGPAPAIPGAGVWSSVSLSRLQGLLG